MKPVVVVYNPKSGAGYSRQQLAAIAAKTEMRVTAWIAFSSSLESELAPYIASGDTIAVVGGDGTQRSVAAIIIGSSAIMAPMPGGTLNHFTKDLGIAQDMTEAFERLAKPGTRAVDVASVNGHTFLNNSSIGLYSRSLVEREKTESALGKWPSALHALLRSLIYLRRYHVTVNHKTLKSPFIFVGNNRYNVVSSLLAGRSSLTEQHLTLFVLQASSRLKLLKIALFDRFTSARKSDFSVTHPTNVHIASKKARITVSIDGEIIRLRPPLEYKIHPGALKVLV